MAYYQNKDHYFNCCKKMLRAKSVEFKESDLREFCDLAYSKKDNQSLAKWFYFKMKDECVNPDFNFKSTMERTITEKGIRATTKLKELLLKDYKEDNEVMGLILSLKNKSGLYFLYDNHKELKYIGRSIDLSSRILSSMNERKLYTFRYCLIENKSDVNILEVYAISLFKPERNSDCVTQDYPTIKMDIPELSEFYHIYNRIF